MKTWKIILTLTLLFIFIGAVSAELTVDDLKAPNGLEPMGKHSFVDKQGHNIDIIENSDSSHETWFENDTDYFVEQYNDTCYIGSDDENDCYILEIIEYNNEQYIITSWTPNGPGDAQIIKEKLEEFNEINQLTPITL